MYKNENDISKDVVDSCYQIHKKLGPGLLESVYEEILFYELGKRNLQSERQIDIPVVYFNVSLIKDGIVRIVNNL